MRLIDADALKADYGMKDDCAECDKESRGKSKRCQFDKSYSKMDFCGWIDDAPTIEPERKVGKWGHISDSDSEYLCCSQCGYLITVFDNHIDVFPRLKDIKNVPYCPNCGAEMEDTE